MPFAVSPSGREIIDSPLIDIFDFKDIKCANPQITYSEDSLAGAEIIARTIQWYCLRIYQSHWDEGQSYTWERGSDLIPKDTNRSMKQFLKDQAPGSGRHLPQDEYLTVRERFTDDDRALLFVGNYYNEKLERQSYLYPSRKLVNRWRSPVSSMKCSWPELYAILTPVCMEVSRGLKILHCTSDILGVAENDGSS